jgi:hypothetical protein
MALSMACVDARPAGYEALMYEAPLDNSEAVSPIRGARRETADRLVGTNRLSTRSTPTEPGTTWTAGSGGRSFVLTPTLPARAGHRGRLAESRSQWSGDGGKTGDRP